MTFLTQATRMAGGSLWSHKVRSLLTILGIVIGIGSVLTIVTMGSSFEASIIGEFDELDTRSVFVTVTQNGTGFGQGPPDAGSFSKAFTQVDVDRVAALDHVERVLPSATLSIRSLAYAGRPLLFDELTAAVADDDSVRDPDLYANGTGYRNGANEIVLGSTLAQLLGRGQPPPVGAAIEIRFADNTTSNATLVGVLKPAEGLFGLSNTVGYVPLDPFYDVRVESPTTGASVLVYSGLTAVATSAADADRARDEIQTYFVGGQSDAAQLLPETMTVSVATQGDITSAIGDAFDQFTLFIGSVAVVSLVVGAIGIANIMLVSVTERTREIGVLKAIGAKDREVLVVFLVEAVLVGFVGALIGILLGLAGGYLLVGVLLAGTDVAVTVPMDWIGLSVVIGVGVGALAGFFPARRATRIEIVRALAYE